MPDVSYGIRLSALFGALCLVYGVQLTYLPVFLHGRGLSASAIAFATSAPLFLRLVFTPTVAFLADRSDAHRLAIMVLGWSALGFLLVMAAGDWSAGAVMLLVVAMLIAIQTIMPLTDTIAMKAVRTHGVDYGGMRLWGSLTFIIATLAAGWMVDAYGSEVVLALLMVAALATVAVAHWLPPPGAGAGPGTRRLSLADVASFAADRRFVLFVLASSAIQASHSMFYVFGVLHWREVGLSATAIGFLWAVGIVAEIVLFWRWRRLGNFGLLAPLLAGGCAGVARWSAMAADPSFAALVLLQVLHALTYAATHLGAMQYIAQQVPEDKQGTAQALLSTFTAGIAMGAAIMLSGLVYARFGGGGYVAMAVLAGAGVVSCLALQRMMSRA